MPERKFIVLKYTGKVPLLAACEKCELKFFTPDTYSGDAVGAQEYLFRKFDHHSCGEPSRKPGY